MGEGVGRVAGQRELKQRPATLQLAVLKTICAGQLLYLALG